MIAEVLFEWVVLIVIAILLFVALAVLLGWLDVLLGWLKEVQDLRHHRDEHPMVRKYRNERAKKRPPERS